MVVRTVDKHMKTQCSKYAIKSMFYCYAFQIKNATILNIKRIPFGSLLYKERKIIQKI
jgi:hypothetical protein